MTVENKNGIYQASAEGIQRWVSSLIDRQKVYGPVLDRSENYFNFEPLRDAAELRLDYDVAMTPLKKYFQPQREILLNFERRRGYQTLPPPVPFVLFGMHPYDAAALKQMDEVHAAEPRDAYYQARRDQATIVVCDVQTPSRNVFAACMGTAVMREGFDVLITRVGDDYVIEPRGDKGSELAGLCEDREPADAVHLGRREQVWDDNRRLLKQHTLKCAPKEIPELLAGSYDHPLWEKKSERCYSCGSCVLMCPTCYCFDVQDELNWDMVTGSRRRQWDGCMLQDFATVAGGHNFRPHRYDRYRHRFYRKGKYLWDRFGQIACIGCGRCVTACTTNIANPVDVYNGLMER